jgi:hypothetical protein
MTLPSCLWHGRTHGCHLGRHRLGGTTEVTSTTGVTKTCKAEIANEDVIVLVEKEILGLDVIV